MNVINKNKITLILMIFLLNCDGKEAIDPQSANALKNILEANQLINDQLFSNNNKLPDLNNLLKEISASQKIVKSVEIKASLDKMEKIIKGIGSTPKQEDFFKSFSLFSEELSVITKKNKIDTSYNRFFCPMVSKTWIAKGTQIKNPYAADMRDCGEIVK